MAQFSRIYNYSFKKKIFFFTSSLYSFSNPHPVSSSPPWDPIHPCAAVRPSNENAAFPRTLTLAAGAKRVVSWRWKRHVASIHRETVHHLNVSWIATRDIFLLFLLLRFGTVDQAREWIRERYKFIYLFSIDRRKSERSFQTKYSFFFYTRHALRPPLLIEFPSFRHSRLSLNWRNDRRNEVEVVVASNIPPVRSYLLTDWSSDGYVTRILQGSGHYERHERFFNFSIPATLSSSSLT